MSLISPLREIMTLREAMDRLFEEPFFRPWSLWRRGTPEEPLRLPVDVYTTPEEIVIVASVPGLLPEEVDVSIQGDTLTIRGELRPPLDNVQYLFQERPYGPFTRSLVLNVPVDVEKAEVTLENGVLTITLPKAEEIKPKTIKVKAK
ncbi:MAG: Hsp20/alpha crystallin family protein [Anaerolineae bacterium]|nr:Hsp20/alpha crystallin family protein [Anaerolineae bacterium]MCX8067905.1 Hsp20/alpha crystallin family protein [Anaerolineae bacterium]MDW7991330.1 Hsp20/alpha crystallin family protein [Anaerolineae bacterium]